MVATDTDHRDGRVQLTVNLLQIGLLPSANLRMFFTKSVNEVPTRHKEGRSRLHVVEDFNTFLAQFHLEDD